MPADPDIQSRRRAAIVDILRQQAIATQHAVVEKLLAAGFDVTQSSVSRDFNVLGVQKTSQGYRLPSAGDSAAMQTLGDATGFIRAVRNAGPNLVVIRTATGAAQRVALAVDRADWPEIVGTVSGDDTLFVATSSHAATRNIMRRLERLGQTEEQP
ncbi:MAG: arginine repressor [Pseudomonadota bacterium]